MREQEKVVSKNSNLQKKKKVNSITKRYRGRNLKYRAKQHRNIEAV